MYLCSSKHNLQGLQLGRDDVVNCFKMCIFAVASTMQPLFSRLDLCCELLQNVYLCSSKHNTRLLHKTNISVVNCFKMCIFAVASTMIGNRDYACTSCELLQNVYLCSSKHNQFLYQSSLACVVNCFKMCIFAVASTIHVKLFISAARVVNCFKMCIFAVASTIHVKLFILEVVL